MSRSLSRFASFVLLASLLSLLLSSSLSLAFCRCLITQNNDLVSARTPLHRISSPGLCSLVQPPLKVDRAEQRCSSIWPSLATLVRWKHSGNLQVRFQLVCESEARSLCYNRLGTDEENFLIDCHTRYGPITYLPWPLCQYLVTDSAAIQSIYNTPSKSLVFVSESLLFGPYSR